MTELIRGLLVSVALQIVVFLLRMPSLRERLKELVAKTENKLDDLAAQKIIELADGVADLLNK